MRGVWHGRCAWQDRCSHDTVGRAAADPALESSVAEQLFATLHTNRGDIRINLFPDHAPKTVAQLRRARRGHQGVTAPGDRRRRPGAALRRHGLPPRHRRLHDPGRRPARHRHRRPGLQVRRRVPPRAVRSTSPTCWRWPTPAPAPTARSSSSPSRRRRWLNLKHTIFGEVADGAGRDVVDEIAKPPDRPRRPPVEPS